MTCNGGGRVGLIRMEEGDGSNRGNKRITGQTTGGLTVHIKVMLERFSFTVRDIIHIF